jgi:methylthioribose-1-phosphate isomerase
VLLSIRWKDGVLEIIDQTKLPWEYEVLKLTNCRQVAEAIRCLKVRGAPAIGVAAAYGVVLGVWDIEDESLVDARMLEVIAILRATRPTAVNLFWALERMQQVYETNRGKRLDEVKRSLLQEAHCIFKEDIEANKQIGRYGAGLIEDGDVILTHCNAGALATAGYGTALGVIRAAWNSKKRIKVLVNETRPLLQGSRLTAWELQQENIPFEIITDSAAGFLMQQGEINKVIVGADRIAANGDVANKIGTYSLAVLAYYHGIPFYVAAPTSTIDHSLKKGEQIPIEMRSPEEVTRIYGLQIAPSEAPAKNPAFDITPHQLITAIITEKGVLKPEDVICVK